MNFLWATLLLSQTAVADTSSLFKAQEAYLKDQPGPAVLHLRDAVRASNGDLVVLNSAWSLLDGLYRAYRWKIPTAWQMPEGLAQIQLFLIQNYQAGRVSFELSLNLPANPGKTVQSARLLINGREQAMSIVREKPLMLRSEFGESPPPGGLYEVLLHMMGDEKEHNLWALIPEPFVKPETPPLEPPSGGARIKSSDFVVQWRDFVSEWHKPYDPHRAVWLAVVAPKTLDPLWSENIWEANPVDAKRISQRWPKPAGGKWIPGEYFLHRSYIETRPFGAMEFGRELRWVTKVTIEN